MYITRKIVQMMNSDTILTNRVASSGLITIKLEEFFPKEEICVFDLKNYLFRELILKELDFRQSLKEHDWSQYQNKILSVWCSNDAIIPTWAYMLIASYAAPYVHSIFFGNSDEALRSYFSKKIDAFDWTLYKDAKVVIKGCSDLPVPASAYLEVTNKLVPIASSIMYGEPCSTVPVFKKKK